jgi:hypothetical protein
MEPVHYFLWPIVCSYKLVTGQTGYIIWHQSGVKI